ncbi:hypothetical protein DSM104299_00939 [Baekduia alba]|uniref:hypothetical protein n=1 Tax=Baekduia alba TaxID=2997333 RepID=UPI0023423E7C|nr:hypothetical protein [Baekduia alba]WCB92249.1 hypothetical protein DSM104299_00939 [Baekduia alba]
MRKFDLSSPEGMNPLASPEAQMETPYRTALDVAADWYDVRGQAPASGGTFPVAVESAVGGESYAHRDMSVVRGLGVALPGKKSALVRSEELLAGAMPGAKLATYLTTGASGAAEATTSALIDTALEQVKPGEKPCFLVTRNVHISVANRLKARGVRVEWIAVPMHPLGMADVVDASALEAKLRTGNYHGVIVSSPTYEGKQADAKKCIDAAHAHGVPIMWDMSWATEMAFTDLMGDSPLKLGADAVVLSLHKSLFFPGQMAAGALGYNSLIPERVWRAAMLADKSTSQSSNWLAAADEARKDAFLNATAHLERLWAAIERSRRYLPQDMLVDWDEEKRAGRTHSADHMPHRLTFRTHHLGYTGYELAALMDERRVQTAQAHRAFFFDGFGAGGAEAIPELFKRLGAVVDELPRKRPFELDQIPRIQLRDATVDYSQAVGPVDVVPVRDAVDRELAQFVGAYPPGIAIAGPTELLSHENAGFLLTTKDGGGSLWGGDLVTTGSGELMVYRR